MQTQILKDRLDRTSKLFDDLLGVLNEESLGSDLSSLPSNTIGQQLWCVIGARNSYLKATKAGKWDGFECPLAWEKTTDTEEIKKWFDGTKSELMKFFEASNELTADQVNFLMDLLEHEVQHHGQLIRYMYGLKIQIPNSWKRRYSLD